MAKEKYDSDPNYRLHQKLSTEIRRALKGNKNGASILNYLPDSIAVIRTAIELQWNKPSNLDENGKVWMNWSNHGNYDLNRRTWQIDHIIPQSLLPYSSMEDENFKICWSVDNLQPLEAIDNIKKGNKLNWKKG